LYRAVQLQEKIKNIIYENKSEKNNKIKPADTSVDTLKKP